MKCIRKYLLILLAVVLVAGTFSGCVTSTRVSSYTDAEYYQTGNFTYWAPEIKSVYVHWYSGDVTFVESSEQILSVKENGEDLTEKERLHWYINGSELRIEFSANDYNDPIDADEKNLVVEIPAGVELIVSVSSSDVKFDKHTLKRLNVYSTSGDISVKEMMVDEGRFGSISGNLSADSVISLGKVSFMSTSGSIEIGSLAAEKIDLSSISGAVRARSLSVLNTMNIETMSGAISTEWLSGEYIDVSSVNGKITLGLNDCTNVSIETTSGNVYLPTDHGMGMAVRFSTTNGLFQCDNYEKVDDRFIIGDGSCTISVSTVSGNLNIE